MGLTRDEVLHIARLARVGLSEEDAARCQEQLSEILDHFDVLRQVDTESVPLDGGGAAAHPRAMPGTGVPVALRPVCS